jgi:hypothetical protein
LSLVTHPLAKREKVGASLSCGKAKVGQPQILPSRRGSIQASARQRSVRRTVRAVGDRQCRVISEDIRRRERDLECARLLHIQRRGTVVGLSERCARRRNGKSRNVYRRRAIVGQDRALSAARAHRLTSEVEACGRESQRSGFARSGQRDGLRGAAGGIVLQGDRSRAGSGGGRGEGDSDRAIQSGTERGWGGGAGMALGKVTAAGYAGEGYRVSADVGYRYRLRSTGESDLQEPEVQAGSGKRECQRSINFSGVQDGTTVNVIADAAGSQCASRPQ